MHPKNYFTLLSLSITALAILVTLIPLSNAEGGEWGPWDKDSIYETACNNSQPHRHNSKFVNKVTTFPIKMLINFFQKIVSPVDGPTCDFYPTCSGYSKQALKKHGFFLGLAMASERIIRDHGQEGYDLIFKFGRYYIYDPVENNDFWFEKKKSSVQ
jgi:putative membrane protein insertion efficiency factor